MTPIRILVRKRKSVRDRMAKMRLEDEPGIELVGELDDVLDVLMAVKHKKANVVVTSENPEDQGMASHLLAQFPDTTLLILGSAGEVYIEQRCRHRWKTADQSGNVVADALRYAVMHPCELDDAAV